MAIKLYADRIEIGDFTLMESGETGSGNNDGLGGGLAFTGEARAQFLSYPQQGTVNGWVNVSPPGYIQKYPFATDNGTVNDSAVSDNNAVSGFSASAHSDTHGYCIGGENFDSRITKFSFADSSKRFSVGSMSTPIARTTGTSSSTHGYCAGGRIPPGALSGTIQRHTFSNDLPSRDVGALSTVLRDGASFNNDINGYRAGGYASGSTPNNTQKYSFSSSRVSISVGDCGGGFYEASEQASSVENGYWGAADGTLRRFSFATDNNATSLPSFPALPNISNQNAWSSTTFGYMAGSFPNIYTIQKFPFASDVVRSSTGSLHPTTISRCNDSHSD
jgi:hypothetical protein